MTDQMFDIEQQFLREIDCRFPYDDAAKWKSLVDQGIKISPNAAFAVLYEICVPGQSRRPPRPEFLLQLLDYWQSRFDHPAKEVVLPAAMALIYSEERSEQDTIKAMQGVAAYPEASFALTVIDISYYHSDDVNGHVEATYNAIRQNWKASAEKLEKA